MKIKKVQFRLKLGGAGFRGVGFGGAWGLRDKGLGGLEL